jgi:hypothetical protein
MNTRDLTAELIVVREVVIQLASARVRQADDPKVPVAALETRLRLLEQAPDAELAAALKEAVDDFMLDFRRALKDLL